VVGSRFFQQPFALSLSKGCLFFRIEGQGFDKLSPNG